MYNIFILDKDKKYLRYIIMSCPFSQTGGARATKVGNPIGPIRELMNGAKGALFNLSNGKTGFRIINGPTHRVPPRPITQAEAQKAFDKYYSRIGTVRRGPRKGTPRFASTRGLKSARTYDLRHEKPAAKIIKDSRYLSPSGPYQFDYPGVDAQLMETRVRKPLSQRQRDNLARGRAQRSVRNKGWSQGADNFPPLQQQGGYWW